MTDGDLNVSGTLECTGCTGGAGVTIILTTAGTCPATVGTVNFAPGNNSTSLNAPTSGTFKGDLIVQDVNGVPGCTTYTSTPTNLIGTVSTSFTGLVYLPHAEMNIFGNPNLGKAGCLVLIVNDLRMSGNPSLDTNGCAAAGVTPPTVKTVVLGE